MVEGKPTLGRGDRYGRAQNVGFRGYYCRGLFKERAASRHRGWYSRRTGLNRGRTVWNSFRESDFIRHELIQRDHETSSQRGSKRRSQYPLRSIPPSLSLSMCAAGYIRPMVHMYEAAVHIPRAYTSAMQKRDDHVNSIFAP